MTTTETVEVPPKLTRAEYALLSKEEKKERHRAQKRVRNAVYYAANREAILENKKNYRESNREAIQEYQKEYQKEYREINRVALLEKKKERYERNREAVREQQKDYYERNREALLEKHKEYRERNAASLSSRRKGRWRETGKPLAKATAYAIHAVYTTEEQHLKYALYLTYMAGINSDMRSVCRRSTPIDGFLAEFEDQTYTLYAAMNTTSVDFENMLDSEPTNPTTTIKETSNVQ
jgi:hypothetical protein